MARFSLGKSLLFSLLAGLGAIPFQLVATPWVGPWMTLVAYAAMVSVLYLMVLPGSLRGALRGAGWGALCVGASLLLALTAGSPWGALLLFSVGLGLVRSSVLWRRPVVRGLVLEGGLLLAAWALVAVVATPSPLGSALGFWSFFLVQSLFVLVPNGHRNDALWTQWDPFEAARDGALAILGEPVVSRRASP